MTDELKETDAPTGHLNISEGEIATEEDFRVKRDEEDNLLPMAEPIPGRDEKIVFYPITDGQGNKYIPDDYNLAQMTDEQKAGLLRENLIAPDFGEVTAEMIGDGDWYEFADPETIIQIIADASGYDILKAQAMEMMSGNSTEILENLSDEAASTTS